MLDGLRTLPGLAHRKELVADRDGVRFVNDSKATNADAARQGAGLLRPDLLDHRRPAKEGGLDGLEPFLPRIRHAFVIGRRREQFATWLEPMACPIRSAATLRPPLPAAADARGRRLRGATVLLSPACASWDQFRTSNIAASASAALVTQPSTGQHPAERDACHDRFRPDRPFRLRQVVVDGRPLDAGRAGGR